MAREGRQAGAALLAAAAGAGIALQHLLQQPRRRRTGERQPELAGGLLQPAQVGEVGAGPGGAAAGRSAAAAGIGKELVLERGQDRGELTTGPRGWARGPGLGAWGPACLARPQGVWAPALVGTAGLAPPARGSGIAQVLAMGRRAGWLGRRNGGDPCPLGWGRAPVFPAEALLLQLLQKPAQLQPCLLQAIGVGG